jgi:hypothetical protein
MTPKDKAIELVANYLNLTINVEYEHNVNIYKAKKCALIAVDLILSEFYADDFYIEVKQEIEKL